MGISDLQIQTAQERKYKQIEEFKKFQQKFEKIRIRKREEHMDMELLEVVKLGNLENFITCLEKFTKENGIPLETTLRQLTFPDQDTFLHIAASYGHTVLISYFMEDHFRNLISCKNVNGDSALHLAARGGHVQTVHVISCRLKKSSEMDDFLEMAVEERKELIKQRIEETVLVDNEGNTALHEALLNDRKEIVEALMMYNVEAAYCVNKQGKSPLHLAVEAGNIEYVNKMLHRESKYMLLLDEQLRHGKPLLHAAIMKRNLAILQKLTEKKPMLIHIKNEEGLGPLDFASSIGFLEGVNFLQDGLKMNNGDKNEEGLARVAFSSSIGFPKGVNFLQDGLKMNNGVNKDYRKISNQFWENQSKSRMKQPMIASETHSLPPNVSLNPKTSTLVKASSEAYSTTRQQMLDIELWEAAKIGDMKIFLNCLEKFSKERDIPWETTFSQLSFPDRNTLLHVAAQYGHEELSNFISGHFHNVITYKNSKGDSALHLAARGGHLGVVKIILTLPNTSLHFDTNRDDCLELADEEQMSLVKQRVEEMGGLNDEGNTALHEALLNDHRHVAEYLIERNVEAAYYINKQGKSPLYMAVEAGNIECVDDILNRESESMHLLDEQLTNGKSILHAAITSRNIVMLQKLTNKKPMLIYFKNEAGLGPVDFASSIGFHEGVNLLQDKIKMNTSDDGVANVKKNYLENPPELRIEDIRQSKHWEERHNRLKSMLDAKKVAISDEGPKHGSDPHSMNLALYIAAKKGNIDGFLDALYAPQSMIYSQMTPLKNTVLHVAASFGNEDLAGFLVHHFRSLLSKRNHRGDTALHVAAIAGHLRVVEVLVRFQIDQMTKDSLLDVDVERNTGALVGKFKERVIVNNDGNTPLHEALKNNHEKVAEYLIKTKIEDAYYVNKEEKSALYMAIEAKKINCVKTILSRRLSDAEQQIIDEEIIKGKSLVHATITARNIELLQEITNIKSAAIHVRKEYGQTPLHHAASINFLQGFNLLLDKFRTDIYEKDSCGLYPIHCASRKGHVEILKKLLQHCPDAREFVNEDNQNILHVAAMYGKDSVVRYILNTPALKLLPNEKDKDGNTPLHLATNNWYPKVASSLTWDTRVDLRLVNTDGLTALEVAEENMDAVPSYRQRLTWTALKSAGAERATLQKKPRLEEHRSAKEPYKTDYSKDRVNTLLLVATLVATVTFAAGFTMPGGYSNSKPDEGMATLLHKLAFQVFVICDTIAMYSAIMVAVSLIWAQLGDLRLVLNALQLAIPMLGISLTMMALAFMAGVYLVISTLVWLANVVLILGIISVACLLSLFIPLNLPYTSTLTILRYISYYPFCLLMLASGSYYDPVEHDSF